MYEKWLDANGVDEARRYLDIRAGLLARGLTEETPLTFNGVPLTAEAVDAYEARKKAEEMTPDEIAHLFGETPKQTPDESAAPQQAEKPTGKIYQNIVSADTRAFRNYIVIGEYAEKAEAIARLDADEKAFREKYGETKWYKINYPFAYATIGVSAQSVTAKTPDAVPVSETPKQTDETPKREKPAALKKFDFTASVDAVEIDFSVTIYAPEKPSFWTCEELAADHARPFWTCDEIGAASPGEVWTPLELEAAILDAGAAYFDGAKIAAIDGYGDDGDALEVLTESGETLIIFADDRSVIPGLSVTESGGVLSVELAADVPAAVMGKAA